MVVVVVRNEILDRILRKELAKLGIQLGRQRLIRRQYQRRAAAAGNHIGHGVGLARARDTQQRLVRQAVVQPFHQLGDGRWLIARRGERLMQPEGAARIGHHRG